MNRILLFLLLLCACFAGCKNTNDVPAQIRAQQAVDAKIITAYLQKNSITAKQVDSAGVGLGIYYVVDTLGGGNDVLTNSTRITVGYTGTNLQTGTTFITTDQFHPSYVLGSTIMGWQYGIAKSGVKKGGTVTLYVPSHYAYGPFAQPSYGLPANAILIFRIKLYNITN
ncbi:FKBP-type peptidyl-prolyl cis-trans isomerase [Mucilaginibacter flavidus]|uniref:FKBP-type peptidyl-prolyl cis-trans isomerase n=1 Tax=Mucilaginibacter flavidus TaxID=2949309 RepID=UPI0020932C74|nr:FKBP-type peptidyl-prolyl cis-trans isomerase [Mucilaginibacter flavidus]MCO5950049.1 FKBP-type peptidyl-prolyl cis-trans isomerase [Mucilaginibacter flavidus]